VNEIFESIKGIFLSAWSGPGKYPIIIIAAVIIIYIPVMIIMVSKRKGKAKDFITNHPEAATIATKGAMSGVMTIMLVNGEKPVALTYKRKNAVYVLPGENVLDVQYQWTRPGVLYRTVTTTVGPTKLKVNTEARGKYVLTYDKKAESFEFFEDEA